MQSIQVGNINLSNEKPMVLIGGLNVLESEALAMEVAQHFVEVTRKLGIAYVFKGSFDKANRSSIRSFRGPGLSDGLKILEKIKTTFNVPLITDIHETHQAIPVAEIVDVLQLPAFLSRQTDLVQAMAATGKPINVKKAQFLAPAEMQHIINKCEEAGNKQVILTERGSCFGYNNLIVDMLGFGVMKAFQKPLIFDVTHALQKPGGRKDSADGRRTQLVDLARAGVSQGIAGLFLEAHPEPSKARCDGPCALPLQQLEPLLTQLIELDALIKRFEPLEIN